jgi:HTH-type transcriptional regulator/antitoxin HigA
MGIKPIRNGKDLKQALARIDEIIDAAKGTAEYDELEVITTLIESYEALHHPIDPPDPVEAIKFRMEQQGLRSMDLAPLMGGKNRVSEVLSRNRPLSLKMIRNLHRSLNIPYESLIGNRTKEMKHKTRKAGIMA